MLSAAMKFHTQPEAMHLSLISRSSFSLWCEAAAAHSDEPNLLSLIARNAKLNYPTKWEVKHENEFEGLVCMLPYSQPDLLTIEWIHEKFPPNIAKMMNILAKKFNGSLNIIFSVAMRKFVPCDELLYELDHTRNLR